MCASFVAGADGLFIGNKSAQDAFHDEGVAKLIKAAINGDKFEVRKLIGSGVNINATGDGGVTPLVWVEINHDLAAMQLLLDLGADPDKVILPGVGKQAFGPPVWMAAAAGRREILEILLNHGANPNLIFGNDTPVMMAIQESHLDCAELLLRHGADINKTVGPASSEDLTFAKNIVFSEMSQYYAESGIDWSDAKFEENWKLNRSFIISIEDSRVGYFSVKIEGDFLYIQDIHVLKDYRYKGVGRFAMNFIINLLLSTDAMGIRLKVFKGNSAIKFYEKIDFTKVYSDRIFVGMEYLTSSEKFLEKM
ncbi:GNAT family N-acetyltransferase [Herbaspirillum sp. RV1423]|uniref:GNAT family N-acetyltransferase n=1 Tax=Herbaspirillum sp. RV1423 TaxID=1443993 RepID=UPI00054E7FCF|nr:GNAT family N-acetyltransferase [Herbaspirillum sp. RV1423]